MIIKLQTVTFSVNSFYNVFRIWKEELPKNGNLMKTSFLGTV